MTIEEAIAQCDFWTPTVTETQMLGSTTDQELAAVFGSTVSVPRQAWTDPTGPRNYDVRVPRYLMVKNEETGEYDRPENPVYILIAEEIARRQARGLRG